MRIKTLALFLVLSSPSIFSQAFITTWKTDNPGLSEDNQITIPIASGASYDYNVDWGDGTIDEGVTTAIVHTYDLPGTYEVAITGTYPRIFFDIGSNNPVENDAEKLILVNQWGAQRWSSMRNAFAGCSNLDVVATDIPDLSNVINTGSMFRFCTSLIGNESFEDWDVSNVRNAFVMFQGATLFNQDIGNWDVGNLVTAGAMFSHAESFNQDIGSWDVSNVQFMGSMFAFTPFNQDISDWDVSRVTNMFAMFQATTSFNQDISNWDVSNVTDMLGMFDGAISFNQPLNSWDVSNVTNMFAMFGGATSFNQPLDSWDVSSVTDMINLFRGATSFDQDLGNWNVGQVVSMIDMFRETGLSQENYDSTLNGWVNLPILQNNVEFNAGSSSYCSGEFSRLRLINEYGWTITDAGKDDCPFITTWKTDNPGISEDNQITIPTHLGETYDYFVDWGDGTSDSNVSGDITHTYIAAGTYQISISGQFPGTNFFGGALGDDSPVDNQKLISIDQWGDIQWSQLNSAFYACANMDMEAQDIPDMNQVFNLDSTFALCESLVGNESISIWDTSSVLSMANTFAGCTLFNRNIENWNVENVTNMFGLFTDCENFNQPLNNWNVGNVQIMTLLFTNAKSFNQPLDNWNVSLVSDMFAMFFSASSFNGTIGSWDVSNVQNMGSMFSNATGFNQNIGSWNVSNVTEMSQMFDSATSFNQDLGNWDISNVTNMRNMLVDVPLSLRNYDKTLLGWSDLPTLQSGVEFDAGLSKFCAAESARSNIISSYGWTIADGGKEEGNCEDIVPFITNWKTDNPGGSEDNQITIPTVLGETYDYTVDWGDGSMDTNITGDITHTYSTPGTYKVMITGLFPRISFFGSSFQDDSSLDNKKLLSVEQWGYNEWTSMEFAFLNCTEMEVNALDIPDLFGTTNMNSMFNGCYVLIGQASFALWEMGNVEQANNMFADCFVFNQDISAWDVSNTTDLSFMFAQAQDFNSDIGEWNTSNVTNMHAMFQDAQSFNQDIGNWDVSNVNDMTNTFFGANSFNQDIGSWNTGNVSTMNAMFAEAKAFNQNIGNWNVGLVTDMGSMFFNAESFDQDIGNWDIGVVSNLSSMFTGATLSTENYDALLLGWSNQIVNNSLDFDAGNSQYCNALNERNLLTDSRGWTISDGGVDPRCYFITTWKTDNPGVSENNQINIPTFPGENYDYVIDWGDGSSDVNVTGGITHTYSTSGTYQVSISGDFPRIYFNDFFADESSNDSDKIIGIEQWGKIEWSSMEAAFAGCKNLDISAQDIPDLSSVLNMGRMFADCSALIFNESIDSWDISNVTNLGGMFAYASSFNQPLGNWNTENVMNLTGMFEAARSFNQPIDSWVTDNVETMGVLFSLAESFNQPINSWNTSKIANMNGLFQSASSFDQPLHNWDVSNVVEMVNMFSGATSFNQDIGNWNVSKVANMTQMFFQASNFNQDIGDWDVSSVEIMRSLFSRAEVFDQDIGNWDVSNVIRMDFMLAGATSFNQNLGGWDVSSVTDMTSMLLDVSLSTENYDGLLQGWASLPSLQNGVSFDAGNSRFCESMDARLSIINIYGWSILDDGENPLCNQDNDEDGILDHKDACLDSAPGAIVDENGCDVIANDAIQVLVLTPSCTDSSDGSIVVSMNATGYLLDISLEGGGITDQFVDVASGTQFEMDDLPVGTYTITISIPEIVFERVFGVTVNSLESVSGKRQVLDTGARTVSYLVSGSKNYTVSVNGENQYFQFEDSGPQTIFMENLDGATEIIITGENDCQGKIEDSFFVDESISIFPTVVTDNFSVIGASRDMKLVIYSLGGRVVQPLQSLEFSNREAEVDISLLPSGLYLVNLVEGKNVKTVKIMKR